MKPLYHTIRRRFLETQYNQTFYVMEGRLSYFGRCEFRTNGTKRHLKKLIDAISHETHRVES